METVTSLKNPRVALWRSLKQTQARRETGLFLVEGDKSVREALDSGWRAEAVLLDAARPVPAWLPSALPLTLVPDHVLAAVCDTKTPQGIAAVMRMHTGPVTGKRLVALDGVQDPGNVGTILRTADALGLDGVLLSADCADPYSPKVLRATMGSVFHLPFAVAPDLPEALRERQRAGIPVLSSQLDGEPFDRFVPDDRGFVLVIGSEGSGVSAPVRDLADRRLCLPMRGRAESLNAAVAAAIMMDRLTAREA
ncbi:MAG: RNA methyltransferase [Clostridia bacterium]|nr:RNA methyltransferase [Clostridia bacterium]